MGETNRWRKIGEMLDLARTARALSKEEHPKLEEMRQLRAELFNKAMEIENNDGLERNVVGDKERDSVEEEEGDVIEKTEEVVEDEEGDVIEKTERDAAENRDIYEEEEDTEEHGIEEPFDPVREMKKLMELEVEEARAFREHIESEGIDLEELGLEVPWDTQRTHHRDEL